MVEVYLRHIAWYVITLTNGRLTFALADTYQSCNREESCGDWYEDAESCGDYREVSLFPG